MTKEELFNLLFEQFLKINAEKDHLITAATTAAQAEKVLENWRQANKNQLAMGNKILIENTQALKDLVTELKEAEKKMDESLEELKKAAAALDKVNAAITTITKMVALGSQLVALV